MTPNAGPGELVAVGLKLKLTGLALAPPDCRLLAAVLWLPKPTSWLLAGVAAAALPDFLGRCLCLAAPTGRLATALSVVFQLAAFAAVPSRYTAGAFEVAVGVVVAGGLRPAAAAFFIRFLRVAGDALGRPDVATRADVLGWLWCTACSPRRGWGRRRSC